MDVCIVHTTRSPRTACGRRSAPERVRSTVGWPRIPHYPIGVVAGVTIDILSIVLINRITLIGGAVVGIGPIVGRIGAAADQK